MPELVARRPQLGHTSSAKRKSANQPFWALNRPLPCSRQPKSSNAPLSGCIRFARHSLPCTYCAASNLSNFSPTIHRMASSYWQTACAQSTSRQLQSLLAELDGAGGTLVKRFFGLLIFECAGTSALERQSSLHTPTGVDVLRVRCGAWRRVFAMVQVE